MSDESPSLSASATPPRRAWRPRWLTISLLVSMPAGLMLVALLARQEPDFYQASDTTVAVGADQAAIESMRQRASGRFLTKIVGLAADIERPGNWSTVIEDEELNAWLRGDLPANHPELLPSGVADLRTQFTAGGVLVGCRVGGPLAGVVWTEVKIRLLEANRLAMTVQKCRLGVLPFPSGLATSLLADSLKSVGIDCQMLRLNGESQLVAQLPATAAAKANTAGVSWWLDGLRLEDGEVFLTGSSRLVHPGGR